METLKCTELKGITEWIRLHSVNSHRTNYTPKAQHKQYQVIVLEYLCRKLKVQAAENCLKKIKLHSKLLYSEESRHVVSLSLNAL